MNEGPVVVVGVPESPFGEVERVNLAELSLSESFQVLGKRDGVPLLVAKAYPGELRPGLVQGLAFPTLGDAISACEAGHLFPMAALIVR